MRLSRLLCVAAAVVIGGLVAVPGSARADSIRDRQWHLDYLRIAQAHKLSQGEGVTVAVIDSGVNAKHQDLAGNVLPGEETGVPDSDGRTDTNGHGTAMASLIAGHGHGHGGRDGALGIAPKAKILPAKVPLHVENYDAVTSAIDWAVDQGADVINVSLRGTSGSDTSRTVEKAARAGAVIVLAVGNTAQDDSIIAGVAQYPGVVVVSGTDRDGNFSSGSVSGKEIALAAPMEDIMAAGSGKRGRYNTGTGTSDSAAIVSGVAALIKSKYPNLKAPGIINRMIKTADDRGPKGRDPQYGFGVVNPVAALTKDVPDVQYNPLDPYASPSPTKFVAHAAPDGGSGGGHLLPWIAGIAAILTVGPIAIIALLRRRSRALRP